MSQDHDPERNEWMEQSQRWLSLNPCHFAWRVVELPVASNPNSALYGASIRIALYSLLFQCLTKQTRQDILPELQRPPGKNKCAVRSFRLLGCKNPYQTHTSRGVLYEYKHKMERNKEMDGNTLCIQHSHGCAYAGTARGFWAPLGLHVQLQDRVC